ncbi:periplasmic divalent cation tolerance protein CutA [Candidatus Blochmanniella floridana]|uniref:Periplasmic divalent cation tolerance protein CutA n=1 Tax=Blochmanniella floridana TaxID=203907 RepID=Q7VQQ1_BLOFL|nr:periplasmic divalent cation tolerance protein CutA [Candidatus Blochmannia floridanus]
MIIQDHNPTSIINNPNSIIIILCTLPDNKEFAITLIKTLLKHKLAACITLLNEVHSFYHWNNKIETATEIQLLIKTTNKLQQSVFNKIQELHPYTIPELLTISVIATESNYLHWLCSNL